MKDKKEFCSKCEKELQIYIKVEEEKICIICANTLGLLVETKQKLNERLF
jgi:hypothetical protein